MRITVDIPDKMAEAMKSLIFLLDDDGEHPDEELTACLDAMIGGEWTIDAERVSRNEPQKYKQFCFGLIAIAVSDMLMAKGGEKEKKEEEDVS